MAVGLPAMAASRSVSSSALAASAAVKDLIVTLTGPFCYWLENTGLRMMAPHVGPAFLGAPHQPWVGTSANQKMIEAHPEKTLEYSLNVGQATAAPPFPVLQGTPVFSYPQGKDPNRPMFNFVIPTPDRISGANPSLATMECVNPDEPYCKTPSLYATALTVLYKNVDLSAVTVTSGGQPFFQPCFENDADLPVAQLGIHLTPLKHEPGHGQAVLVWERMLALYPWIQKEIKGISLCTFDTSSCPPQPVCKNLRYSTLVGPGNNCEAPIMLLSPSADSTGRTAPRKK